MKADVTVGFAADAGGNGVAYARVGAAAGRVMRVPFNVKRYRALLDREVGYAALAQVVAALRSRGVNRVRLSVENALLADEVREHRDVPPALAMAYVRLGCALNQFAEYEIAAAPPSDLTARAESEVAMHAAA